MVDILVQVVTSLLGLLIGTGILVLVTKLLKVKGNFKIALLINAISVILSFVLGLVLPGSLLVTLISLVVVIFLIKKFYELDWGKAVIVWLVWAIASLIFGFLVGFVVGILFVGSLFA